MRDTRERIVEATAALFMQQGYSGTGLKAIAQASEATTGSLYHFFPGGKAELAAATLRHAGAAYGDLVMAVFDAEPDVVRSLEACFAGAALVLEGSGYADACPIATVALEVVSSDEALRRVVQEVFADWLARAGVRLEAAGIGAARAGELATLFIAALEGGFLLCRAARDTAPMAAIGRGVVDLVRAELAAVPA